jgi:hypothetical protein
MEGEREKEREYICSLTYTIKNVYNDVKTFFYIYFVILYIFFNYYFVYT